MHNFGIVPAAGLGTRLYPFKGPKELLPLGSQIINEERRPKLVGQYIIEAMSLVGVNDIIMPITPRKTDIVEYFLDGSTFGLNISYLVTEHTASMVETISLAIKNHCDKRIFFGMPDTCVMPTNCFEQLLANHLAHKSQLSLGLFYTSEPQKFGMVKVNQNNEVVYHKDKPKHTDAKFMWGIAIWEPSFSEYILKNINSLTKERVGELAFGDVMDRFMDDGNKIYGFVIEDGQYYDVGTYDGYKKAIIEL